MDLIGVACALIVFAMIMFIWSLPRILQWLFASKKQRAETEMYDHKMMHTGPYGSAVERQRWAEGQRKKGRGNEHPD